MAHEASAVACMKDPTEWLRKVVGWVEDAGYVVEEDVTIVFPILNGEKLDIDMADTLRWDAGVDNLDGSLVVNV